MVDVGGFGFGCVFMCVFVCICSVLLERERDCYFGKILGAFGNTFCSFNLAHIVSLSFQVAAAGGRRQSIVGAVSDIFVCVCVRGRKDCVEKCVSISNGRVLGLL